MLCVLLSCLPLSSSLSISMCVNRQWRTGQETKMGVCVPLCVRACLRVCAVFLLAWLMIAGGWFSVKRSCEGGEQLVAAEPSLPHRRGSFFKSPLVVSGETRQVFILSLAFKHIHSLAHTPLPLPRPPPCSLIVMSKARFLCRSCFHDPHNWQHLSLAFFHFSATFSSFAGAGGGVGGGVPSPLDRMLLVKIEPCLLFRWPDRFC